MLNKTTQGLFLPSELSDKMLGKSDPGDGTNIGKSKNTQLKEKKQNLD